MTEIKLSENKPPVKGRFAKGQSGNPGGRPKSYMDIVKLARDEGAESIKKLVQIRDDPEAKAMDAGWAADKLLDRGFGKPSQSISVKDSDDEPPIDQLTDDQIEAKLSALAIKK